MFLGEIDTYRGIDTYCVATNDHARLEISSNRTRGSVVLNCSRRVESKICRNLEFENEQHASCENPASIVRHFSETFGSHPVNRQIISLDYCTILYARLSW